jgi:hypothetical protein
LELLSVDPELAEGEDGCKYGRNEPNAGDSEGSDFDAVALFFKRPSRLSIEALVGSSALIFGFVLFRQPLKR